MSRRRTPTKPAERTPPKDGSLLGHLSDAELYEELVRRRMPKGVGPLEEVETLAEDMGHRAGEVMLEASIAALPPEGSAPKPCPKCGKPVPVKTRNRARHLMTLAGELRLARNYHYCRRCRLGFHPRDIELKLPEAGEVSNAMERRILDFGINDTFESAAERWGIHYPRSISSNLVRKVIDRAGLRLEDAASELVLQRACRASPEQPVPALVVATDGSMLHTREEAWREAKVAVVAHLERSRDDGTPHHVSSPRYVAVLGGKAEFSPSVGAALAAEHADEVAQVAWLGDGAPSNWTLASDLCPFAIQILDIIHALQHGNDCGKALLGEADPALPQWNARMQHLIEASQPDALIRELVECLPFTTTDGHLDALDGLVAYYRTNEKRMQYTHFRELGLPVGSGIVESAHRHVLHARMKRAGQQWSLTRGRRMARLRAAYRTAGAKRFHRALRDGLVVPTGRTAHKTLPNGPRRAKRSYALSRVSGRNRAASK